MKAIILALALPFIAINANAQEAHDHKHDPAEQVKAYDAYLKQVSDFEGSDKFKPDLLSSKLPTDVTLGDPNAPVTIVEYASLGCVHCKQFHQEVFYKLKKEYIDTGKVFFKYRDYPLNAPALKAALVKDCLPEDQKLAYIGAMFESQSQWAFSKSEADLKDKLKTIAAISGMDKDAFETCYSNKDKQDAILASMKEAYDSLMVTATPAIFINGKRFTDSRAFEGFSKHINGLLEAGKTQAEAKQ